MTENNLILDATGSVDGIVNPPEVRGNRGIFTERGEAKLTDIVGAAVLVGVALLVENYAYTQGLQGVEWAQWYLPIGIALRQAVGGVGEAIDYLSQFFSSDPQINVDSAYDASKRLAEDLQQSSIDPVQQFMHDILVQMGLVPALGGR